MDPATVSEWLLRAYDLFLLYLAILLGTFAGFSLLAYLAFLCDSVLSSQRSARPAHYIPGGR